MKKQKDGMLKNAIGTIVDVTIGGVAMNAVSGSSMSQGFKDITNLGIGVGIAGKTYNRFKKSSKGGFL